MEQNQKHYYAFISYSSEDEKTAKWLCKQLEGYRIPAAIQKDHHAPKRLKPIFLFQTDLSGNKLRDALEGELNDSQFLIVICSPAAVKSNYVNKEVQHFIDSGRYDKIIPFIIEGTPYASLKGNSENECFPPALVALKGTKQELRGIDLKEDTKHRGNKMAAIVDLIATMLGVRLDTLWLRYEQEDKRKLNIRFAFAFSIISLFAIGAFLFAKTILDKNTQIRRVNMSLNISLAKTYLSQNRPEMALIILKEDIEQSHMLIDSLQCDEIEKIREAICDSIIASDALLIDIADTLVKIPKYCTSPKKSNIFNIKIGEQDDYNCDSVFIAEIMSNLVDTIVCEPNLHIETNRDSSFIAIYVGTEANDVDTAEIRIYSLESGILENRIGCGDYYSWTTYPMALSSNGRDIIYHDGGRAFDAIVYTNLENSSCVNLSVSYTENSERASSSFSPNDYYFYLYFYERNEIIVYSTYPLKPIHMFHYEDVNDIFWNDSNILCVSSKGKIYSWEFKKNNKSCTFNVGDFANGVNLDDRHAAVACNNGKIYIWDLLSREMVFAKEITNAPQDVAFTKDGKQLWVIDGYNCINIIDLDNFTINTVYVEEDCAPHPWDAYLYMTENGKYCITRWDYGDKYALWSTNGYLIKKDILYDEYIEEHPEDNLAEFILPNKFGYDPELSDKRKPELTAQRHFPDKTMYIEGYSNGVIKVYIAEDRTKLESLVY